jgi:hypothetical protein
MLGGVLSLATFDFEGELAGFVPCWRRRSPTLVAEGTPDPDGRLAA